MFCSKGLEVAFIVTVGANQHRLGLAVIGGTAAIVLVAGAGVLVRRPLARVSENAMKFAVDAPLTSFGMLWGAEGAGAEWPGDSAILVLLAFTLLVSLAAVASCAAPAARPGCGPSPSPASRCTMRVLRSILRYWYDFIVGDDATIAVGVVLSLAATAILAHFKVPAWWLMPVAVVVLLGLSPSPRRPHHQAAAAELAVLVARAAGRSV